MIQTKYSTPKLLVEQMRDHKGENNFTREVLLIAFKGPGSYLIGNLRQGIKIIENGSEIYSGLIVEGATSLSSIEYIWPLDCYLIACGNNIYRKDIDSKPPYIFLEKGLKYTIPRFVNNSKTILRYLCIVDHENIHLVNTFSRKREISLIKRSAGYLRNLKLFNSRISKLICTSDEGRVLAFSYHSATKRILSRASYKPKLMIRRGETPVKFELAVCPKAEYIMLALGSDRAKIKASRVMVLRMKGSVISCEAQLDEWTTNLRLKTALSCYGYLGKVVYFFGMTINESGTIQSYEFDTRSGGFKELTEMRVSHGERFPCRVQQFRNSFYYTGNNLKVMRLSVKF